MVIGYWSMSIYRSMEEGELSVITHTTILYIIMSIYEYKLCQYFSIMALNTNVTICDPYG